MTPLIVLALGLALVVPSPLLAQAQPRLNEILAANGETLADEDGDFTDWIELYNAGAAALDLAGYTLTDDPAAPGKWTFPARVLAPHAFLLVWASGKNRTAGGELHASFKLEKDGEFVGLYTPAGAVADSLSFGEQARDVALARIPDGAGGLETTALPTPGASNQAAPPATTATLSFSAPQGEHPGSLSVALATDLAGAQIRTTRDGTPPTATSALYTAPLAVDTTQVVRARVFAGTEPRSPIEDRLYVVGEHHHLPIASIVTDPGNLWDPETGIYVHYDQHGPEWEREIQLSLIEDGQTTEFSVPAGIRIQGGWNRQLAKKSFRLDFRSDYGAAKLEYPLFPDKPIERFDTLLLHSPSEDHPLGFATWTHVRESLAADLMRDTGHSLLVAHRPVAVYLNQTYWGIYWLRERVAADYLQSNLGITDPDLLEDGDPPIVQEGNLGYWSEMWQYLETHDPGDPQIFADIRNRYIDTDNYADYNIINIFAANWDWPHNNTLRFHDRSGPHPFRWVLWNVDNAWASELPVTHNTLAWATRDTLRDDLAYGGADDPAMLWGTTILRRLLENAEFRRTFINRFADLLNTSLSASNVQARAGALAAAIQDEVPLELARWADWCTMDTWFENLDLLQSFAEERPDILRAHLVEHFGLAGTAALTIEPSEGDGTVEVNTIAPASLAWTGIYFRDVPVTLTAGPAPGWQFAGWSDPALPGEPTIALSLGGDRALQARFVRSGSGVEPAGGPPLAWALEPAAPNPFRTRTAIGYALVDAGPVRLDIYNVLGEKVRTLVERRMQAGAHRTVWDSRTETGRPAASGVYVVRLEAGRFQAARRILLLR